MHTGLCLHQHTDGQSAHCLSLGSVAADAVSLILNSWGLKRGKNHQRRFLATSDITPALHFFAPQLQTSLERKDLLFASTRSFYPLLHKGCWCQHLPCQNVPALWMRQKWEKILCVQVSFCLETLLLMGICEFLKLFFILYVFFIYLSNQRCFLIRKE